MTCSSIEPTTITASHSKPRDIIRRENTRKTKLAHKAAAAKFMITPAASERIRNNLNSGDSSFLADLTRWMVKGRSRSSIIGSEIQLKTAIASDSHVAPLSVSLTAHTSIAHPKPAAARLNSDRTTGKQSVPGSGLDRPASLSTRDSFPCCLVPVPARKQKKGQEPSSLRQVGEGFGDGAVG